MAVIFQSSDACEVEVPTGIDIHDAYVVPDVIQIPDIAVPGLDISDVFAGLYPFQSPDLPVIADVDLYQVRKVLYNFNVDYLALVCFYIFNSPQEFGGEGASIL